MKSPRENPAKQHVVLRPAPFDTETEARRKCTYTLPTPAT